MSKIMLDRHGDLRKGVFYRFGVDLSDMSPAGDKWIVVNRDPPSDESWIWIQDHWQQQHLGGTKGVRLHYD